ncbi:MAG: hypothetical protein ACAI38_19715, partial [Myxococcota bacterium]
MRTDLNSGIRGFETLHLADLGQAGEERLLGERARARGELTPAPQSRPRILRVDAPAASGLPSSEEPAPTSTNVATTAASNVAAPATASSPSAPTPASG